MPSTDVPTKAGEVYVVMLQGETAPYTMFSAMKAIEAVVEPKFGPKLDDRMMAELVAMWKSDDKGLRIRAIKQIGIMRDTRGSEQVNAAAKSEDAQTARAGVIAQYRMKIAPDAKRTMELFDQWMMVVWCRESGDPQRDANGNRILRRERGRDFIERPFMVRGLPDFDYATYVREGIKKDWVRKDDHLLDAFFSVPWKVQRKACIPELVELLDDPNKRVRWGAVLCLTHTVDHADRPRWEQFERHESEELGAWRKWWKEEGDAYMARHATPPAAASPPEQPAANPIEHRVEPAGDPRSGAKIELVADKQEYFLGENVLLHYGVTNQGKQPFVVSFGGDSRSFPPRALRFKVVAIDENGRPIDDPYPAVMSFGGPGGDTTLEPGKAFWNSFPLMLYCDFLRPGVYKIRVYHDLGWEKSDGADKQHDNVTTNALPKGPHHAPIVETTVKLTLPDPQQARRVVAEMLSLPTDAGSWGERAPPRQDVTVLRHPVYLPIVEKLAQQGSQPATTAVGSIPTPEATRALIRLLDCPDRDVAAKSLELLLRRLPISDLDYRAFGANQRRLARRAWRDEMQPAVVEVGWRLMAKKDRASLIKAAQIIECLGRPSDFPRFIKELDRVLGEMKDDPTEQNAFPRPANASGSMIRAGWQLIERGAAVPTDPQTPGQAALFMLALGRRADFRPADWQATAGELLRHPIPYVRSVTLENLRNVPLGPLGEAVIPLLSDEHLAVSVAACALAAATKSKQYRKPLLEVLRAADDQWLMQEAHRAAIACGADRDRVLEICIDQLGRPRPADSSLYPWILALMIEVVEQEGGTGHSHTDWSAAGELAARWRELLEANREQIRAGKRFKIAEPPLTPDLFPRGFQFQRKDNPPWPDWSSRAAATPKEPGREEDERNGENNAGGEAAVEDEESEARRVDGNLRPDPFSELDLRRAMAVAEVAQLEYVTAMEANEKVPGTVPKVELKRLETAQRLAELDVERARLSGSDDDATENTDTLQPDTEEKKDPAKRIAAPSRTTVRGKVVDDVTGKPVANFITQAGKFDPADPAKVVWGYSETRGGWKSSTFSATVRWPEGWTARIVAPGYLPQPILAEPPSPGQDAIDVVIRLKRGDTIRGRVLDHTGQGVAKAGVYLAGRGVIVLAEGPWDELQGSSVHTDAEGRFEISGRGEDSKAIFVTAPTLYVWRADLPEPGQEVTIRLPEPAKLHIRYDIEGGPPAARVRIELRT
ncbi:MAG: carboxypeptidase regulatory-like domain-containing protein, partial [Planctomycetes bacterium]|nr:carboxypeptidase regulatory-like domain-containing protein [Planctomycetota bacterium]